MTRLIYETVKAAKYYDRGIGDAFVRDGFPTLRGPQVAQLVANGLLTYKNGKLRINRNKSKDYVERCLT